MLMIMKHLFERDIDENACMAVVPYRLHVQQECHQEAHQYGEELNGEAKLASVSKNKQNRSVAAIARHQDRYEGTKHDCC